MTSRISNLCAACRRDTLPHSSPRLVVLGPTRLALDLAVRNPGLLVIVFEPDWASVDSGRREAEAMGLDTRVTVHHQGAAELAWWASRIVVDSTPRGRTAA